MNTSTDIVAELRDLKNLILQNQREMLTAKEAATYMGCSVRSMREHVRNRDIPYYKDPNGRAIRFKRHDLDAWMQYLRVNSQQEIEEELARRSVGYKNRSYGNDRTHTASGR